MRLLSKRTRTPAVISAALPDLSHSENIQRHQELLLDLEKYEHQDIHGHWRGQPELSVYVSHIPREDADELARKYSQLYYIFDGQLLESCQVDE